MADTGDRPKRSRPRDSSELTAEAKRPSRPSISGEPDFGTRYRVIGRIGKGGMGEVFRAYDVELKCEVALKTVNTDGDVDAALARFRREIALCRKITSTNVLRIYDLDEHEGRRFLSMELVDGEDLASLLKRGKLPQDKALSIFRQICVGLAAAHAQNVIHRDLKPHNVLVDKEGTVRVADFGLARSIDDDRGVTGTGAVLGSPGYMSPEQVKGDPLDARSDIYSLGIILYQLLAGETPFQAATPHAVMEMRLHKPPRPLREVASDVPSYLEAIVSRALAIDPRQRYSTVGALLADLESGTPPASLATASPGDVTAPPPTSRRGRMALIAGGGLAVAGVALALAVARGSHDASSRAPKGGVSSTAVGAAGAGSAAAEPATTVPATSVPGSPVVLVLGVENRTGEPLMDRTIEMIVYQTLRRSAYLDPLAAAPLRWLAGQFSGEGAIDEALGKKLAARDHLRVLTLRGTVAAKGSAYVLSLVAQDAVTGATVVNASLDAASREQVVPTVARLVAAVRTYAGETLTDAERDMTGLSTSLDADTEFTVGYAKLDNSDYKGALEHFRTAVKLDPGFARAHVQRGLAASNLRLVSEATEARQAALKDMAELAERDRLRLLADYYLHTTQDYARGIAAYDELLAKWPRDAAALSNSANALMAAGQAKRALELTRKAAALRGNDAIMRGNIAAFEVAAGEFEAAVAEVDAQIAELPNPTSTVHLYQLLALHLLGKRAEAHALVPRYAKAESESAAIAVDADLALAEGRVTEAVALLEKGLAADVAAKAGDEAEVKLAMLAEARARSGDTAGARAAAAKVTDQPVRVLSAALAQIAAGDTKSARATAAKYAADIASSHRAVAKVIEGELLRAAGKPAEAMLAIQSAIELHDRPFSHLVLARAAIDAKRFAEAYSELERLQARRGELANDVDDITTVRYVPLITYYLAKAQEGLGSADATATYKAFLAQQDRPDATDPFVADARKHAP